MAGIGLAPGRPIVMKDVSDVESRAAHGRRATPQTAASRRSRYVLHSLLFEGKSATAPVSRSGLIQERLPLGSALLCSELVYFELISL
jgi:hypothetical protein